MHSRNFKCPRWFLSHLPEHGHKSHQIVLSPECKIEVLPTKCEWSSRFFYLVSPVIKFNLKFLKFYFLILVRFLAAFSVCHLSLVLDLLINCVFSFAHIALKILHSFFQGIHYILGMPSYQCSDGCYFSWSFILSKTSIVYRSIILISTGIPTFR